jgi:hypothetical protein
MVDLAAFLTAERVTILGSAQAALRRAHLPHYEVTGTEDVDRRLCSLFELLVDGIARRDLTPMIEYSERVAEERYAAGFQLGEVQTAFNTLEEATWTVVLAAVEPTELARALGLVGTVLGAGKDALARRYVALAASTHAGSLDLRALFSGAAS